MEHDNVGTALALLQAEVGTLKAKQGSGSPFTAEEAARLDGIQHELSKLREQWIVDECRRGTPQWRVAEIAGVSPSRISQILRLYKVSR